MVTMPDRHPLGRTCGRKLLPALFMTAVVLVKMACGRLPKSW